MANFGRGMTWLDAGTLSSGGRPVCPYAREAAGAENCMVLEMD